MFQLIHRILSPVVVGVPGHWRDAAEIEAAISKSQGYRYDGKYLNDLQNEQRFEIEIYGPDADLQEAFALAGQGRLPDQVLDQIGSHTCTLYLLASSGSTERVWSAARAVTALLEAGGLAVKVETAGKSHASQWWLEMVASHEIASLYQAFVQLVQDDTGHFSCGMRNFGFPDAAMSVEDFANDGPIHMDALNLWQLVENPHLADGHTFQIEGQTTFQLRKEKYRFYPKGHSFHNRYGAWRLTPANPS